MSRPPLPLFIIGATATGKSALAMILAQRIGAAILVMDSMQVYRGMDIGTSKPSMEERSRIRHGGLDLVEPGGMFDVVRYLDHVREFLNRCGKDGTPVIVVGGTGLYYRAMTTGFCSAPPVEDSLRREIAGLTLRQLQERLKRVDPGMFSRIDGNNPRRLQRAIEVKESTGRSLLEWQQCNEAPLVKEFQTLWLQRGKLDLRDRIEQRTAKMLKEGWPEEVQGLVRRLGLKTVLGLPAIGYPEIAETLERGGDVREVEGQIVTKTWQYARRQITWFRRENNLISLEAGAEDSSDRLAERALELILNPMNHTGAAPIAEGG